MALKIRYNFAWMMSGQVLFSGLQFLIVILLARLTTPETLGAYSLALAVTTPIVAFCCLGLRTVFTTDFSDTFTPQDYLWLRAWGMGAASLLILTAAFFYRHEWLAVLGILTIGAAKIAESFSDIYYAFRHKEERLDLISKSMIIRASISTAALTLCILYGASFLLSFGIYALLWWLTFLFYDRLRFGVPPWGTFKTPAQLKSLFYAAVPLGIATTVYMVAQNGVRYVIEFQMGLEALGEFSAVAYGIMPGQIVINVLGSTLRPRMAQTVSRGSAGGRRDFWRLTRWGLFLSAMLGFALFGGAWLLGEWAILIVYGENYTHLAPLFTLLGAASIPFFMGTYLGFVLSATGAYIQTLILSLLGVLTSFVSAWLLVPSFGLMGAALSLALLGCVFCLALPVVFLRVRSACNVV